MKFALLSPLHRAVRQVTIALEEAFAEDGLDLNANEGHALIYIGAYGPCPTGDVQRVIGLKRSTLTSLLDRLAARRLIDRRNHPDDRRVVLIETTAAGRRLVERMKRCGEALERRILRRIDASDRAALTRVLTAIDTATGVTVVARPSAATAPTSPTSPTESRP